MAGSGPAVAAKAAPKSSTHFAILAPRVFHCATVVVSETSRQHTEPQHPPPIRSYLYPTPHSRAPLSAAQGAATFHFATLGLAAVAAVCPLALVLVPGWYRAHHTPVVAACRLAATLLVALPYDNPDADPASCWGYVSVLAMLSSGPIAFWFPVAWQLPLR